jgi:hypothetical protein
MALRSLEANGTRYIRSRRDACTWDENTSKALDFKSDLYGRDFYLMSIGKKGCERLIA